MDSGLDLLLDFLAQQLVDEISIKEDGYCMRVDHLTSDAASSVCDRVNDAAGESRCYVLVTKDVRELGSSELNTEKAIELRNRKPAAFVLLVPTGVIDSTASSLRNAFAALDLDECWKHAQKKLTEPLPAETKDYVNRVLRSSNLPGISEEDRAAYCAAVASSAASDEAAARELYRVGLIPDATIDVDRLGDNIRASKELVRPVKSYASLGDRLDSFGVQAGQQRQALEDFFRQRQLSDWRTWMRALADSSDIQLRFSAWDLTTRSQSRLRSLKLTPWLNAEGEIEKWSKLEQPEPGTQPIAKAGPRNEVKVRWESDPKSPEGLAKWRVEMIPSGDFYTPSETPDVLLPSKLVKGTVKQTSLKLGAIDWPEEVASIVVQVRLTAVSENGGELCSEEDDQRFEAISGEIQLRPESDVEEAAGRSSRSLKTSRDLDLAKLKLAVEKTSSDLADVAFQWSGRMDNVFNLELCSGDRIRIGYSPALKNLEQHSIANPQFMGRWDADVVVGDVHDVERWMGPTQVPSSTCGELFMAARRRFFENLADRGPRQWLAITSWTPDLDADAQSYVDAYVAWLEEANGAELELALAVDTGTVRLRTDGRTINASLNAPLHPLKVGWLLTYRGTIGVMRSRVTSSSDSAKERREKLDFSLLESVNPIGCPMLSCIDQREIHLTIGCLDFLWTVGLPVDWPDPERGLALISQALGVTSATQDDAVLVSRIARHVNDYLALHPHAKHLRFVTDNAGDGQLSSDVLCSSVAVTNLEDQHITAIDVPDGPERIELLAYFRRPLPAQLPGLESLRQTLEQRGRIKAASVFQPLLETAIRPSDQLTSITGGGAHLTLLMDVTKASVGVEEEEANRGSAGLAGLLCPFRLLPGGPPWRYCVPDSKTQTELTQRIIQHQRAVARLIGGESSESCLPVLQVAMEGDVERLTAVHDQSDWVITLDRFVEPAWIESNAGMQYLLDYSPDVSDGLSRRLFVSTGHREEAERLLWDTLTELGVESSDGAVTRVLHRLRQVSGRLALRAFGSNSSRREATALAIALDHMLKLNAIAESVLIPVDSHMEVFAAARKRGRREKSRRCDLLAVSLTGQGGLRIRLFEVKGRSHRPSPDVFATIQDQLESTRALLDSLWCDESRLDREFQLYRFRQILEYHLRRAVGFRTVTDESPWHAVLEGLVEGKVDVEMSMHGIIVCPRAMSETVMRGEVAIDVIGEMEIADWTEPESVGVPVQAAFVLRKTETARPSTRIRASEPLRKKAPESDTPRPNQSSLVPEPKPEEGTVSSGPDQDANFGVRDIFGGSFDMPVPRKRQSTQKKRESRTISSSSMTSDRDTNNVQSSDEAPRTEQVPKPAPVSDSSVDSSMTHVDNDVNDSSADRRVTSRSSVTENESAKQPDEESSAVEVVMGDGSNGPAVWKPAVAGSPHLFIIGIPGQGKSVTTTRLLSELTKQDVPSLVLDFHGEFADPDGTYAKLANPTIMDAADGLPFSILEAKQGRGPRAKETIWELAEICQYVCSLGDIQRDALYRAFEAAYESAPEGTTPLLTDVGALIDDDENEGNAKNVVARCRPLFEFGLFADSPSEAIYDQFRKGAVIDLHHLNSEALQLAAGAFTLRKLYRAMFSWGPAKRIRLAIVLDEAHRLAKDLTLPRIMKEGRKFGVAVVVASQDVRDFHEQVLSNAGTKVVFRVNYPDSKKVAGFVRAERGDALSTKIERLKVGEAMMQSPDMPAADWVRMRQVDD